ncbi:MAG: hypothetical protein AAGN46_08915 [Acidobacteriota bacterium]
MSLINDALRKARQEAAERDASERGVVYRPPRAHLPPERRIPAVAVGLALGVLLAVLVAVGGWFVTRPAADAPVATTEPASADGGGPSAVPVVGTEGEASVESDRSVENARRPRPVAVRSIEPETTETKPSEGGPGAADRTLPETAAPETVAAESASPGPGMAAPVAEVPAPVQETRIDPAAAGPAVGNSTEGAAEGPSDRNERADEAAQTVPANEAPISAAAAGRTRTARPPETIGRVGDDVFVLEAEVDGTTLRLDFVVWSSDRPLAQINGRLLSVGQEVEGWRLVDLERERATLERGDGRRVVLRVR